MAKTAAARKRDYDSRMLRRKTGPDGAEEELKRIDLYVSDDERQSLRQIATTFGLQRNEIVRHLLRNRVVYRVEAELPHWGDRMWRDLTASLLALLKGQAALDATTIAEVADMVGLAVQATLSDGN